MMLLPGLSTGIYYYCFSFPSSASTTHSCHLITWAYTYEQLTYYGNKQTCTRTGSYVAYKPPTSPVASLVSNHSMNRGAAVMAAGSDRDISETSPNVVYGDVIGRGLRFFQLTNAAHTPVHNTEQSPSSSYIAHLTLHSQQKERTSAQDIYPHPHTHTHAELL